MGVPDVLEPIERIGLPRLLRLGVLTSLPALWYEIAVLHFRGSFQSKPMWVPVATLPIVLIGGIVSVIDPDERRSRARFRPLAILLLVLGAVGTFFHLRGVRRQMGGFRNAAYNVTTGPPFPAPAQIALFGVIGGLASRAPVGGETARLVASARAVNVGSYALLLTEAGYSHWMGGFFNRVMYVPLLLSPLLAGAHLAAAGRVPGSRAAEAALSAVAVAAGLVGFGFHSLNIARRGGLTWQNLFYGPPVVAPLQLTAQGVLGLLAAAFDRRR